MRLYIIMMLTVFWIMSCNANSYEDISYDDYEYRFINKPENKKIVGKVKEYVNSDNPEYWKNLSSKEVDIWLDYALYTGARYGYGYGTDVLGFVKVAMTAGAGFMVDDEADYELRRIMHNNNLSEFRKIDKAIEYLDANNFPEPKPTKEQIKRVVWISKMESNRKQAVRKPSITVSSTNSSEGSVNIEEIILDNKYYAGSTGIKECGTSINGGGGSASLYSPPPMDAIYVKWYSWTGKKNIEAKLKLPGKEVMEALYYYPPWYESEFHQRPRSAIIIDIRPNNKVWIKFASDLYPKSQQEIMIIGEGIGKETDEVVTKFDHYKEDKNYRLDCIDKRNRSMERWSKWEPTTLFDDWYPSASQNKEEGNE